jgi:hypothetical protein
LPVQCILLLPLLYVSCRWVKDIRLPRMSPIGSCPARMPVREDDEKAIDLTHCCASSPPPRQLGCIPPLSQNFTVAARGNPCHTRLRALTSSVDCQGLEREPWLSLESPQVTLVVWGLGDSNDTPVCLLSMTRYRISPAVTAPLAGVTEKRHAGALYTNTQTDRQTDTHTHTHTPDSSHS